MPTSATTAAMPMAMPTIVNPVRTGPPQSPRVTTVKKVMSVVELGTSETIRPSLISMMRAAWRAMPRSCVTRISVKFCSRRSRTMRSRILVGVFAVEIPVGSSARRTDAPLARLRAMATRWRSPPDSLAGK